jgi:hypothetical protein
VSIGGIKLAQIARDALLQLSAPPLHFRPCEVLVPVVHGLELAAIDGDARRCEKATPSESRHRKMSPKSNAPASGGSRGHRGGWRNAYRCGWQCIAGAPGARPIEDRTNALGKCIRDRFPPTLHYARYDRALIEKSCSAGGMMAAAFFEINLRPKPAGTRAPLPAEIAAQVKR